MAKTYRKMPGRTWVTLGEIYQVWMSADHLLLVGNSRFHETYRRFYFSDIQAIVVRRTKTGFGCSILHLFLLAITGAVSFGGGTAAVYAGGVSASLLGATLVFNLIQGPTCVTHLQTAVQTVELPTLRRLRAVRKFLRLISPPIEGAQGLLEESDAAIATAAQPLAPPSPAPPAAAFRPSAPAPRETVHLGAHRWLFLALLGEVVLGTIYFSYQNYFITFTSVGLSFAIITLTVIALIRQRGTSLSGGAKTVVWLSLGWICLQVVLDQITFLLIAMETESIMGNYWTYLQYFSSTSPWELPWLVIKNFIGIAVELPLGCTGLLLLWKHQRERTRNARPV